MNFQAGSNGFSDDNGMGSPMVGCSEWTSNLNRGVFPRPEPGTVNRWRFFLALETTSDSSEDMEPFDEKKMRKRKVRCLPARKNAQNSEIGCVLLASGIHGLAREHDWRLANAFTDSSCQSDFAAGDVCIMELERGIA